MEAFDTFTILWWNIQTPARADCWLSSGGLSLCLTSEGYRMLTYLPLAVQQRDTTSKDIL